MNKIIPNNFEILLTDLIRTSNLIEVELTKLFQNYDITAPQYNIMRIIRGANNKPLNAGTIKERMIKPNSDVTRLVDRLVNKELVHRAICPTNKRQMEISITKIGNELLDKIALDLNSTFNGFYQGIIMENESKLLINYLSEIRNNIKNNG